MPPKSAREMRVAPRLSRGGGVNGAIGVADLSANSSETVREAKQLEIERRVGQWDRNVSIASTDLAEAFGYRDVAHAADERDAAGYTSLREVEAHAAYLHARGVVEERLIAEAREADEEEAAREAEGRATADAEAKAAADANARADRLKSIHVAVRIWPAEAAHPDAHPIVPDAQMSKDYYATPAAEDAPLVRIQIAVSAAGVTQAISAGRRQVGQAGSRPAAHTLPGTSRSTSAPRRGAVTPKAAPKTVAEQKLELAEKLEALRAKLSDRGAAPAPKMARPASYPSLLVPPIDALGAMNAVGPSGRGSVPTSATTSATTTPHSAARATGGGGSAASSRRSAGLVAHPFGAPPTRPVADEHPSAFRPPSAPTTTAVGTPPTTRTIGGAQSQAWRKAAKLAQPARGQRTSSARSGWNTASSRASSDRAILREMRRQPAFKRMHINYAMVAPSAEAKREALREAKWRDIIKADPQAAGTRI